ncbi:MAG: HAMP domain-containing sensor histidine kinase [Imperialibacter sp.]|uniref:sensor histidine kinase n=1 Tax=Imperialibacter sp. TaxID=2038411 RepID=UPI0032EE98C6
MSKLLDKPLKTFTLYALFILACSIPAYYLVVDYIWLNELDEHNEIIRTRMEQGLNDIDIDEQTLAQTLNVWNNVQPGTTIAPALPNDVREDSIYTASKLNIYSDDGEIDRFRGLQTYLNIYGRPYKLTIETNVEEVDETLFAIALITFLFFGFLVLGFILLNRRISGQVWLPFKKTLDKLKDFDLNKQSEVAFDKTDIEEFEELQTVLKQLIQNNASVYLRQKQFSENASHELQTPLALLKSKLDMMLQDDTLSEAQYEKISSLNLPLSRVSRINKNLLLLAKLENQQFDESFPIDLGALIDETTSLLADQAEARDISTVLKIDHQTMVTGNKYLVEIMLTNLLVNAIRHNVSGGAIAIDLTGRVLTISNSGSKPLKEERLFQRFGNASPDNPSSGLGLSIVREICQRYNWKIRYDFKDGLHTFSATF